MSIVNKINHLDLGDWGIPLACIAAVGGVAMIIGQSLKAEQDMETVVTTSPAGLSISARFIEATFNSSTEIITDEGAYLVNGVFQLSKGNPLIIEDRKSGDRYLCDKQKDACRHLAN